MFSVAVFNTPPPAPLAELPLTVQLVSVAVLADGVFHASSSAGAAGGVSADGAVGQRGCAQPIVHAAAAVEAVRAAPRATFPLTVQLVSVAVPSCEVEHAAAAAAGGVSADGAVGQRGRSPDQLYSAAAVGGGVAAEVQLLSVAVRVRRCFSRRRRRDYAAGGVVADGAVGQRKRAVVAHAPAL